MVPRTRIRHSTKVERLQCLDDQFHKLPDGTRHCGCPWTSQTRNFPRGVFSCILLKVEMRRVEKESFRQTSDLNRQRLSVVRETDEGPIISSTFHPLDISGKS